jgi:hypothetical protein
MANNGAPDSWEQQADSGVGEPGESPDVSGKFSTLNVNAAEFVPSFLPRQAELLPKTESPESADELVPVTNGMHLPNFYNPVYSCARITE